MHMVRHIKLINMKSTTDIMSVVEAINCYDMGPVVKKHDANPVLQKVLKATKNNKVIILNWNYATQSERISFCGAIFY